MRVSAGLVECRVRVHETLSSANRAFDGPVMQIRIGHKGVHHGHTLCSSPSLSDPIAARGMVNRSDGEFVGPHRSSDQKYRVKITVRVTS